MAIDDDLSIPVEKIRTLILDYTTADTNSHIDAKNHSLQQAAKATVELKLSVAEQRIVQLGFLLGAEHSIRQLQLDDGYRQLRYAQYPPIPPNSELSLIYDYLWFEFRVLLGDHFAAWQSLGKHKKHKVTKRLGENLTTACLLLQVGSYSKTIGPKKFKSALFVRKQSAIFSEQHSRTLAGWSELVMAEQHLRIYSPQQAVERCETAIKLFGGELGSRQPLVRCHVASATGHAWLGDTKMAEEHLSKAKIQVEQMDASRTLLSRIAVLQCEAQIARSKRQYGDGFSAATDAIELISKRLCFGHPMMTDPSLIASDCAYYMGDVDYSYVAATWAARSSAGQFLDQYGEALWRQARARNDLGETDEAKRLLEQAAKVFRESLPESHPRIRFVSDWLKDMSGELTREKNEVY